MNEKNKTSNDYILNFVENLIKEKIKLLNADQADLLDRCFPGGINFKDLSKSKTALDLILRTVP